jgi:hypothetical protein
MAVLPALHGASNIFPVFVGAASSALVWWKGVCFYENVAWLEFNNDSGTAYSGDTVHIKVRLCCLRCERLASNCCRKDRFLPRSFQFAHLLLPPAATLDYVPSSLHIPA